MRRTLALAIAVALAAPALAKSTRTPIEARWQAWEQHQRLERESLFAGLKWRAIGPTVQGGRIVDIEVHPDKPYTFYVAYASGGVWKTDNNGVSFTPLSDRLATMISGDLAIDPQQPDTLWVGSGEPNSSRSSYSGLGMFVSRDGGSSFAPAGLDDADRIARVRVDPQDSARVFVAVQGPLYTPGGMRGIYRSVDACKSWQQVLAGGPWAGGIDLVFDPRDSKTVYAALWERSRRPWEFVESGPGSGVWKSTDGGDHWTRLPGFPQGAHIGRIGLAISPAKPDRLYASIDNQEPLPEDLIDLGDSPISPARLKRMSKEEFLRQDPDAIEALVRYSDFEPSMDGKKLCAMLKSGELTMEQLRAELSDGNAALFDTDIRGLDIWHSEDAGGHWARANREPIRDFTYTTATTSARSGWPRTTPTGSMCSVCRPPSARTPAPPGADRSTPPRCTPTTTPSSSIRTIRSGWWSRACRCGSGRWLCQWLLALPKRLRSALRSHAALATRELRIFMGSI